MRYNTSIPRRSKVRVLGGLALLLFCLNLLAALDHHCRSMVHTVPCAPRSASVSPIDMLPETPGRLDYNRELRLRATQRPETDEDLQHRLGLHDMESMQVPIMQ